MTRQSLQQAAESRRSIYSLNKNLPVGKDEVVQIVEHAVLHTPSSFNSQSARVVVLFGEEHDKVWQFVEDALRAVVPADSFEPTAQKLNLFKAGAATILFYEDQNVVKGLQEQFPAYAANFPVWADQARYGAVCRLDDTCRGRRRCKPATLQSLARCGDCQSVEYPRKLVVARTNGYRRY